MARDRKETYNSIAAHARRQIMQARSEVAASRMPESSLGAVKKVQISMQDPTVKKIIEIINK
jgi:hypothetical protein